MKKIILNLLLILLFANNAFCEAQKIFAGSSSYFDYTLDYPSNWQARDMHGCVVITEPSGDKERVLVVVADLSKKPVSLEEFSKLWLKIAPSEMQDFQIINQGATTINEKKAFFYIYSGMKNGINLKCKRYAFSEKTNIYEVTYEAREEKFDKYLNVAEGIIKSIKVK